MQPPTAVRKRRAQTLVLVRPEPPTAVRKRRAQTQRSRSFRYRRRGSSRARGAARAICAAATGPGALRQPPRSARQLLAASAAPQPTARRQKAATRAQPEAYGSSLHGAPAAGKRKAPKSGDFEAHEAETVIDSQGFEVSLRRSAGGRSPVSVFKKARSFASSSGVSFTWFLKALSRVPTPPSPPPSL